MPQIVRIKPGESPQETVHLVVIRKVGDDKFQADGNAKVGEKRAKFFFPAPAGLDATIDQACAWADEHYIPTVYVESDDA